MAPIVPITAPALISIPATAGSVTPAGGGFQQALSSAIQQVENSSSAADTAVKNYLSGANQELHSTILATQNADLDFEMLLQVRNKVVSAYEEVMKMQI
jgi:flagellar hook-basal body complex protein FliE